VKPHIILLYQHKKGKGIFQEQNMLKAQFKKEDLEKKLQNLGKNQAAKGKKK